LNGKIENGQNVRVFPISNWTELDVWSYIEQEQRDSIYLFHKRKVFLRWNDLVTLHMFIKKKTKKLKKELFVLEQ
jgi:3'-phosphoadenosine 5'-phosphosulfate sulfotransferase (PAPS reductase)/FAD synthetase